MASRTSIRADVAGLSFEPIDDLDEWRHDWTALAALGTNLFGTWEWVSAWWRHFGVGRELLATAVRARDGRLVAILPLYVAATRPVRTLRFLGGGLSDRLHPVCGPADEPLAAAALRRALGEGIGGWQVFFGEDMPAEGAWAGALDGRRWGVVADHAIHIEQDDWDAYLATRSASFRQKLRTRERKLVREHDLHFRLADDPGRLPADVETLVRLHGARFGDRSSAFSGAAGAFHREFAALALDRGWLRLWLLELGGEPAAVWYGFRFNGAEWFYNAGREPAFGRAADGYLLMIHTIREALADGVRDYLYLRGDDPYKARFANRHPALESVVLTRGPVADAALLAAGAARSLSDRGRRPPGRAGSLVEKLVLWSQVARDATSAGEPE